MKPDATFAAFADQYAQLVQFSQLKKSQGSKCKWRKTV